MAKRNRNKWYYLILLLCVIIGCKGEKINMQKLRFVNANGEEIDLTSGHYGITKWNGFSNANLNLQTQQVPYQDGSVFIDGLLNNRELSVTLCINDDNDLSKRYELRNELIRTLNPKLGEGYLYYKNDFLERRIKVIPQLPVIQNKNSNESGTVKASLSWTACSVYWEDVEETSVNINMGQRINVENTGDIAISPKISFNCNSALNPVLRNLNNGKKVSINGTLSKSVLNLEKGKKTFLKTKYGFTNNNNYNNFEENDEYQYLFSSNCISRTKDFENFETIYIMPNETVLCSGYGRGLFFYGGDNLKKSTDCITWETISEKPSGTVQAMYYDKTEDIFYFGIGGHLYSTSDLATFTDVGFIWVAINAITRHGSLIICVGNGGICYKYDGTNFTEITTGTNYNLFAIASDGTNLVIGGGQSHVGGVFKYSFDNGDSWNDVEVSQKVSSICYSNTYGIFFACGDIIVGKGLPDNMVWEELGTEARSVCKESKLFGQIEILGVDMAVYSGEFKKLCNYPYDAICGVYFKGKYIAAGAFGHIYTSDNYTWWEESSASGKISNNIYFAEIANDTAYFFTKEGDIIYTTDGVNFNFKIKLDVELNHIAYFNGYYYGATRTGLYKFNVNNLEDITLVQSLPSGINNLTVINNKLIVFTSNSFVITSDGTTWDTYSTATNHSAFNIVFYNNKYIYIDSQSRVYETSDFENYTEILTEYRTENTVVQNIICLNNEFFFSTANNSTYEGKLYKGYASPVVVNEGSNFYMTGYYVNNKYIFNYYEFDENHELISKSITTDFEEYNVVNDYLVVIDNNNEYHIDSDSNLILNNTVIHNIYNDIYAFVFDGVANNIFLDNYNLFSLPSATELTSSINNIASVYSDDEKIYFIGSNLYVLDKTDISSYNVSSPQAVTGYDNYIYVIGTNVINKYLKTDLENPDETISVTTGTIQNGAALYYNGYLIWENMNKFITYNLSTGIKTEISTNVLVADIKVIDDTVFAIGQNGFLYSSDMKNITELYKVSFVFTTFVRNDLKKFIALYGVLGEIVILNDENIISMITDISFELSEGENEIVLNCDSGYINAIMTYRQCYAGV